MDYNAILNSHALSAIKTAPDIPDYHLMVGTAECLERLPVLINQAKIPTDVAQQLAKYDDMTNEDIVRAIDDQLLEINDFNGNTAIIGGLIGGARS